MKTKYPNQIDTPSELPIVRDNITEITSDIINSLRSAIIQIEKTLGVNPQGSVGQTVAERISSVIDPSGNLTTEAIDAAGFIHGPIFNDQISEIAAIDEHKLKLNFPTKILQSQVSVISSLVNEIQSQIDYLSATLSAHISPSATNRHVAQAIAVSAITSTPSSTGIKTFEAADLQATIQTLVDGHLNYTGDGINSGNNSHSADQIFFDNQNVSSVIDSSSVQGAIEEIAGGNEAAIVKNLAYLTKNGIVRYGKTNDSFSSETLGETLVDSSTISFLPSSASTATITFDNTPTFYKEIAKFDILTISGAVSDGDNKTFYISSVTTDGSSGLISLEVFGKIYSTSAGLATGKVTRNNFKSLNPNGLNSTVRLRDGYSNTPDIIVANPNAATITSFGLRPDLITSTVNSIKIQIDDYSAVDISCYNSSLGTEQSIDSIVDKLNEGLSENHLACLAYKTRTIAGWEISLSHIVPNFSGDLKDRSIKVSSADSNDSLDALGLSSFADISIRGSHGNSTFINGQLFRSFQGSISLSNKEVSLGSGSAKIDYTSGTLLDLDIRTGDLVVVTGSSVSSDDGLFVITSVSETQLILDAPVAFTFTGTLGSSSSILVIRSSAPLSELNFEEVDSASGLMMIDIFATQEANIFYSKRMELSGILSSTGFFASVVDVSSNFINNGETYTLNITTDGLAYLEDSLSNTGDSVYVANSLLSMEQDNTFKIRSPDGLSFVVIRVISTAKPLINLSCFLYGGYEISKDMLWLSRCLFSNGTGRIFGTTGTGGVPSVIDKRNFGSIDMEQICPGFLEKYIEGTRNDIRSSGIISGCQASIASSGSDADGDYLMISASAGTYLVSGSRKEFAGIINLKTYNISLAYLAINEYGILEIARSIGGGPISQYVSPFLNRGVAHLGYLNSDSELKDLRFFVSNLDGRLTHDIIVAKSTQLGHFTDIQSAVNYCSLFYDVNYGKDVSSPIYSPNVLIREGQYIVDAPIIITEDITISGVGKSTVLKRGPSITDCSRLFTDFSKVIPDPLTAIFIIGDGPSNGKGDAIYTDFEQGVTIKDLSYYSETLATNSSTCFCLLQGTSGNSSFTFSNICATGAPERATDVSINEYFIFAGRINTTTGVEVPGNNGVMFITGNYLNRMGAHHSGTDAGIASENIAVEFSNQVDSVTASSLTVKDIVCTSNIAIGIAPTSSSEASSILRSSFSAAQYSSVTGIIEASNAVRTGV